VEWPQRLAWLLWIAVVAALVVRGAAALSDDGYPVAAGVALLYLVTGSLTWDDRRREIERRARERDREEARRAREHADADTEP
jgi:hypothetical protein